MARRISAAAVEAERPRNRSRYDWEEWSDGKWWEAARGEDFDVEPKVFARAVNNYARLNGKQSETTVVEDKVRFRILPNEDTPTK